MDYGHILARSNSLKLKHLNVSSEMLTDGVVWITMMFLSAVLKSHSDGTHSLQFRS